MQLLSVYHDQFYRFRAKTLHFHYVPMQAGLIPCDTILREGDIVHAYLNRFSSTDEVVSFLERLQQSISLEKPFYLVVETDNLCKRKHLQMTVASVNRDFLLLDNLSLIDRGNFEPRRNKPM
jgi:hypothetical protein